MFKAGDRVHHIGRKEDGTVLEFDAAGVVRVEFDNPTPRGNRSIGEFDEVWFKTLDYRRRTPALRTALLTEERG